MDNEIQKLTEYIIKEVNKIISMKRKCGKDSIHQLISSIPYFNLGCFLVIEDRLCSDYPSLKFDIEVGRIFDDQLLVSGNIS